MKQACQTSFTNTYEFNYTIYQTSSTFIVIATGLKRDGRQVDHGDQKIR